MPAPIVVVHDRAEVLDPIVGTLRAAGYEVADFASSMAALNALENASMVRLLITRFNFPDGQPNGVSLARIARHKLPGTKVLFIGRSENKEHADGVGAFLQAPATPADVLAAVKEALG